MGHQRALSPFISQRGDVLIRVIWKLCRALALVSGKFAFVNNKWHGLLCVNFCEKNPWVTTTHLQRAVILTCSCTQLNGCAHIAAVLYQVNWMHRNHANIFVINVLLMSQWSSLMLQLSMFQDLIHLSIHHHTPLCIPMGYTGQSDKSLFTHNRFEELCVAVA